MEYVNRIGVAKAYEYAKRDMDIEVEFEDLANYNIYEELGLNRGKGVKDEAKDTEKEI